LSAEEGVEEGAEEHSFFATAFNGGGGHEDCGRRRGGIQDSLSSVRSLPNVPNVPDLLFQVRDQDAEGYPEHPRQAFVVVQRRRPPFLCQEITHRALGHPQPLGEVPL